MLRRNLSVNMKNKSKILILSIYPAPYRMSLFDFYAEDYDIDIFFEHNGGDARDNSWFSQGKYRVLENAEDYEIYRSLDIKSYALVLVFDYSSAIAVKLIQKCKRNRIPYVINCDGVIMARHGNFIKDILKKYLVSGASMCFASGENAKRYFLKYGAAEENILIHTFSTLVDGDVMPRLLSSSEKLMLRQKLGLPQSSKIAVAVGRFIALKRYNELIREWKNMPSDYVLLIIGGGEEEERYRQTISELGLNNVILLPFFKKESLFEYYKASDIFVHPTSYDVWGLVVNEAMACGLSAVVSDCCVAGLELIENGKNGYIIPMGDDAALCERVAEILSDESLREQMGENSLKTIEPYTIENMARTHIEFFKKQKNIQ